MKKNNAKFSISKSIDKQQLGIFNLSNFDFDGVVSFYSDKKLPLPCVFNNSSSLAHAISLTSSYSF